MRDANSCDLIYLKNENVFYLHPTEHHYLSSDDCQVWGRYDVPVMLLLEWVPSGSLYVRVTEKVQGHIVPVTSFI